MSVCKNIKALGGFRSEYYWLAEKSALQSRI